jgi:ComF family protein
MIGFDKLKFYPISFFDFLLPRFCPACKQKLSPDENTACKNCISKIKIASAERLVNEFGRKFADKNIISGFFSAFVFEKDKELQHIIHALKYDNKFLAGIFLGQQLGAHLMSIANDWKIDLIIPIPLHQLKKAERGFNQSYCIAKGVNRILNLTFKEKVIKRKRFTESQTTMNIMEREENITGAFKVTKPTSVKDKTILLIDDVITTGATISESGRILLESGAKKIYAASVAIAD